MSEYYAVVYSDSLSHHGIKGQKWGQRRFQNEDGSLTDAGRSRYGSGFIGTRLESGRNYRLAKKAAKEARKARDNRAYKEVENAERSIEKGYKRGQNLSKKDLARQDAAYRKYNSDLAKSKSQYKSDIAKAKADRKEANSMTDEQKAKLKKGLMIAAGVAVAGAAAYAGAKYMKNNKALETMMKDANNEIRSGKRMVENLRKQSFEDSTAAAKAGLDFGSNPVTSKSITYLGNDLKQHRAAYDVYARRSADTGLLNVGKTFENPGASYQKQFESLKEYKNARKAAGMSNYVLRRKKP
jgi:hypothetical protein